MIRRTTTEDYKNLAEECLGWRKQANEFARQLALAQQEIARLTKRIDYLEDTPSQEPGNNER